MYLEIARRFLPHLIVTMIVAIVLGSVYFWGSNHGYIKAKAHYESIIAERDRKAAEALAQAIEDEKHNSKAAIIAERKYLEAKAATEAQFRVITETVTEYVQANPDRRECDAPADFVRVWNSANRGSATGLRLPASGAR
jgi:hypothetical protein